MAAPELGPWSPLAVGSVVEAFAGASFRWWVSGGHALDLHLQRSWRAHEDTDLGVVRRELADVYDFLSDWDVHIAAAGRLTPWRGEALAPDRHQNNLWCRVTATAPWALDVTIGDGTDEDWVYRRDPSVHAPWDVAVLRTADGIPYLAPELQLLYKSRGARAKDDVDAAEVIPCLDAARRTYLAGVLAPGHPWQHLLV